jgi:ethanolaminephosphotransferase
MSVIAEATFPLAFAQYTTSEVCRSRPDQDVARLACAWREAGDGYRSVQMGAATATQAMVPIWSFLRQGQDMLSGAASNYDLDKMYTGIAIAALGVALAITSILSARVKLDLGTFAISTISLAYGTTMFASSYVEEEQQFWYWAVGGWLIALHCKE